MPSIKRPDDWIPLCRPAYYEPDLILADWRMLEQQHRGTEQGDRFARLIQGLEQDHSKPDPAPPPKKSPGRKKTSDAI